MYLHYNEQIKYLIYTIGFIGFKKGSCVALHCTFSLVSLGTEFVTIVPAGEACCLHTDNNHANEYIHIIRVCVLKTIA